MLGGFASSRVLTYCLDGVDPDSDLRWHQHAVFTSEVVGTLLALVMMFLLSKQKRKNKER